MKITIIFLIILISIGTQTTSCKSSKKLQKAINKNDSTVTKIIVGSNTNNDSIKIINETIAKIKANNIDYTTFSAKVKVSYEAEEENIPDLNAFIRMKKDSIVWINVEKFGISLARIVITKDSFLFINKYDKNYRKESFAFLQNQAQIPFDFETIQNLLVGNIVYFTTPISSYKKNESTTAILSVGSVFKHLLTINNNDYLIQHSKLDDIDVNRNRTCDLSFSNYELEDAKNISKERTIVLLEKKKIQIDLKFKNVNFNEVLNYPFSIPASYKKL